MSLHDPQQFEDGYKQAFSAALLVQHRPPGLLRVTGADRFDLLNRLSTNKVPDLQPGAMRRTILTNALARVIDVITLFSQPDELSLMTSPERAADVEAWLSGYIFFQDDVQISSADPGFQHWGVYGPAAHAFLRELDLLPPSPARGQFHALGAALVWLVDQPGPGGYELLVTDELDGILQRMADRTHERLAGREIFNILRIESGVPLVGAEITQETIPLEVGLWDEVSFTKGCYIGQEILARMESRGQLARRLVLLEVEGELDAGMHIWIGERDVGQLTSVAHSPRHGWIGLALVKADALNSHELTASPPSIPVRILDPLQSARVSK